MPSASVERTWILDAGATWHTTASRQLVADDDGSLTLGRLPGKASPFDLGEDAWPGAFPASLAGRRHRLFVLDARSAIVERILLASGPSLQARGRERIATIGGRGVRPRRLLDPQGLAELASGDLVVADTGNHRVQVFSGSSRALVHVWGRTDPLGRPVEGDGDLEFRHPWDVAADRRGVVYVVDRGNRRIQRIDRLGRSLGSLAAAGLGDPTRVAVGPEGSVAVIDSARQAVWVFSSERALPRLLEVNRPSAIAFSPQNLLYIGDELGRIQVYASDSTTGRWPLLGSGVTGVDGIVAALHWWDVDPARLVAIIADPETGGRRLWTVDPAGAHVTSGRFAAGPLDSQIAECRWHRVLADAVIPDSASIEIDTFTADSADAEPPPLDEDDRASGWVHAGLSSSGEPDALVKSEPGRYLWLRATLRSNGDRSPAVRRITISYPRAGYLDYLPAAFQEDDESRQFLERFLAIFQSGFDDLDRAIDDVTDLFDPYRAPAAYLRWLAAWLAVTLEPDWSELERRRAISAAVRAYSRKGTIDGIRDAVKTYAHVDARIVEHFKLRRWARLTQAGSLDGTTPLWSRSVYQRYQTTSYSQVGVFRLIGHPEPAAEALDWGASRFSVLFQADPYHEAETRAQVARVVEREKPAHTAATLCAVFPRFRIGVQSSIGLDSAVGGVNRLVLNQLATLNYDTILGCAAEEDALRAVGSAVRPRAGMTTRLA